MSASPTTAAQPELDEALLMRAWRLLRPPCWPATYQECMQDPLRAQLVQMYARQLLRSDATLAAKSRRVEAPAPAITHERRRPAPHGLAPGTVDRKRAAAGDRDDD